MQLRLAPKTAVSNEEKETAAAEYAELKGDVKSIEADLKALVDAKREAPEAVEYYLQFKKPRSSAALPPLSASSSSSSSSSSSMSSSY